MTPIEEAIIEKLRISGPLWSRRGRDAPSQFQLGRGIRRR